MIRVFKGQFVLMYTSNAASPAVSNVDNSETIKKSITAPLDCTLSVYKCVFI